MRYMILIEGMGKLMVQHEQVLLALQSLQNALMNRGHWSECEISADALASQQPFCLDTMNFSQWLQFVFLMRMRALCDAEAALPSECGIAPMIEEFAATRGDNVTALKIVLEQLDGLLSGGAKLP